MYIENHNVIKNIKNSWNTMSNYGDNHLDIQIPLITECLLVLLEGFLKQRLQIDVGRGILLVIGWSQLALTYKQ